MDKIRFWAVTAAFMVLMVPFGASATVSTQAQACGADFSGLCDNEVGGLSATAATSGSFDPEPTGTNIWDVTAAAEIGAVHVFASATSTGGFHFNPPYAVASGYARFDDTLTFSAATGVTEPISLTFVLSLDGACTGSAGSVDGFATSGCFAQARLFGPPQLLLGLQAAGSQRLTMPWQTNSSLGIAADLSVSGFATDGYFEGDFGNTGHVYTCSTTPGVSIVSAGGHDYALPVPEAPSAMLLGVGLLVLGWRHRGSR